MTESNKMSLDEWKRLTGTSDKKSSEKKSKYNAVKTSVDGIKFDSKKEAEHYAYLKMLESSGEITNLKRQVSYQFFPSFKVNGHTYRSREYIADFVYTDKNGNEVIEDVKGMRNSLYKLKRTLFAYFFHKEIKEI